MRFNEAITIFCQYRALTVEQKSNRGYELDLRQFALYLRNPLITQVTADHVVEYINGMKELGWTQNTIQIKCTCLRQFFKFWKKKGYPIFDCELIPYVKKEYQEHHVARSEEITALLTFCDQFPRDPYFVRMAAMIAFTADTGARAGEICALPVTINTTKGEGFTDSTQYSHTIKTEKTRGNNPFRKIFWYEDTNIRLQRWLKIRKSLKYVKDKEYLFVGIKEGQGRRNAGQKMSVQNYGLCLRKLSRAAGLKTILNAHSMRHRVGNLLGAGGANNSMISDILGHASLESSYRYTHLNNTQLSKTHIKYVKKALKKGGGFGKIEE